jgi:hypothetical protein
LDQSYKYSIVNLETGLPMWLAICWRFQDYNSILKTGIEFNTINGHTLISSYEIDLVIEEISLAMAMNKTGNATLITANILEMCTVKIQGIALWLSQQWLKTYGRYPIKNTLIEQMLYYEFENTAEPVVCSPWGNKCLYQIGHMKKYHGMKSLSFTIIQAMADLGRAVNTNPASLFAEGNNPQNYNSNLYCKLIYHANYVPTDCDDLYQTIYYGKIHMPAGFWGVDNAIDASNSTKLDLAYSNAPLADRNHYLLVNCNISNLLIDKYRQATDFHEEYMVRYLNKFKDPTFNHKFTRKNLSEIAWAQFGGGFATYALVQARTSYQIHRTGMWYFRNAYDYYIGLVEFSSWAIRAGYHHAIIYDVDEAKTLLYALGRRDEIGKKFRQHIIYTTTTLVGNGNNLQWGIGKVGETAFTPESNLASFLWPSAKYGPYYDDNIKPCRILNAAYDSSGPMCQVIEDLYLLCLLNIKQGNSWLEKCTKFQTSISDSSNGIACNDVKIMKNDHPYRKSRGNIVFEMLSSLTQDIKIKQGLWCQSSAGDGCSYSWGGMFSTTTVRQLLFEGYTEPTILRYLNQKHEDKNISFSCVENSKDVCGNEILRCNHKGIYLNLPDGSTKKFLYGYTPVDEYFAPKLEIVEKTGQMIWSHAMDSSTRNTAITVKEDNTKTVLEIINPFWAAYPAWQSNDPDFNKYYQCQKRVYGGPPNLFSSCITTIDSGTGSVDGAHNILKYLGNESIHHFAGEKPLPVYGATEKNQFVPYKWSAFQIYPYTFQGESSGSGHNKLSSLTLFNKQHALTYLLSQKSFIFQWEAEIAMAMPIYDGFDPPANGSSGLSLAVRRFVEDEKTWEILRKLGTPKDFYGMPYLIPKGMASLEKLTGFQLFVSTPHMYGNELWNGVEFSHVNGYKSKYFQQRTFVDYDAITGLGLRSVTRQQIMVKVERNPLLVTVFSSQDRCVAPTNKYGGVGLGYGCYAYVPLFWFEDTRIISNDDFYRKYDHYYSRPTRASNFQLIGAIISAIFVFIGICGYLYEHFHMAKFYRRIYID